MANRRICKLAIAIGLGNYVIYALTAMLTQGDALHGVVANGHYFLGAHGVLIEVGQSLFLFCKWQAYGLVVTFPLGLWGARALTLAPRATDVFSGGQDAGLSPHAS